MRTSRGHEGKKYIYIQTSYLKEKVQTQHRHPPPHTSFSPRDKIPPPCQFIRGKMSGFPLVQRHGCQLQGNTETATESSGSLVQRHGCQLFRGTRIQPQSHQVPWSRDMVVSYIGEPGYSHRVIRFPGPETWSTYWYWGTRILYF